MPNTNLPISPQLSPASNKSWADPSRGVSPSVAMQRPLRAQSKPLSCSKCRQRKVKCDKSYPCNVCRRSGINCVYPVRQERFVGGKSRPRVRNTEVVRRLSRLERLLSKYESDAKVKNINIRFDGGASPSSAGPNVPSIEFTPHSQSTVPSTIARGNSADYADGSDNDSMDCFMNSEFWSSLSDQITGLKELLGGQSDPDDIEVQDVQEERSYSSSASFDFGADCPQLPPLHPPSHQITLLCHYYLANVHPVLTVLHRPSLKSLVQDAVNGVNNIPGGRTREAVLFAMYYSAAASMADSECIIHLGVPKDKVLLNYRRNAEIALARADFLNRSDFATLQALTIFLFTVRSDDPGPTSWTLTAIAIRIAYGLGLNREMPGIRRSAYDVELRRRLWQELYTLDVRASEDRGSLPIIYEGSYDTKEPANINDEDFAPWSEVVTSSSGWKDTTFGLLMHQLMHVIKQINYAASSGRVVEHLSLQQKQKLVTDVHKLVGDNYMIHCNMDIPFQLVAAKCTHLWFSRMQLMVQYPVQPLRGLKSNLAFRKDDLLRTAVTAIENAYLLETNPDAARWFWCSRSWRSWQALAVMLAHLYVQPSGLLSERAWAIAQNVFERWSKDVADSDRGALWRPIKKLYQKISQQRREGSGEVDNDWEAALSLTADPGSYPLIRLPTAPILSPFNIDQSVTCEDGTCSGTVQQQINFGADMQAQFRSFAGQQAKVLNWVVQNGFPQDYQSSNHWSEIEGQGQVQPYTCSSYE